MELIDTYTALYKLPELSWQTGLLDVRLYLIQSIATPIKNMVSIDVYGTID
jgi:hypothetical protein